MIYALANPAHIAAIVMAGLVALAAVNGLVLRFAVLPLLLAHAQMRQHEAVAAVCVLERRLAIAEKENRRLRGTTEREQ